MSDWQPIETAPVDGRMVEVREADGATGFARVVDTRRGQVAAPRFRHLWMWSNRMGKAYPTHWRPKGGDA